MAETSPLLEPIVPKPGATMENCMDQYKAYLADLGNIGTRYATVQGFYVSVISALLGILALTESSNASSKLLSKLPIPTLLVVCLFSIVLCCLWRATVRFYQKLFGAKIAVLREMENFLPFKCFTRERQELMSRRTPSDNAKAKTDHARLPQLLRIEHNIPLVLIVFFIALFVIRLVAG